MDPQDAQRAADVIGHAARSRHQVEIELRIRRPDSVRRWIRCVAAGSGEAGLWPKLFGTIQDITEQKALQQLLEERVAERTAALEAEIARREQAQGTLMRIQRMEAYGQLTGGIAHDFNNLLTVIGGNLELLDEQITDQRLHRMLARAIGAVEMGSRLTRRLLSFARRSRLEPQVINLNDQVIGVIDLLRRTIGETITISSNLAPELGHVRVDPSEIENAILNLAINARDAMPEGGKVIIETENATLDDGFNKAGSIDAIAPGAYVRLSVTDTGTGMTPEVLARAFEPFFTTKEPGRGTGLGLASIYGFARQSNGTVRIESEPGKGATVSLYLPRIDDQAARGLSASAQESAMREAAAQRRILVVEDNPDVRDITTQRLTRLGYQVASCDSGPAAVAALSSGAPFDLVFSDVVMAGGMSGYDLAAWVMRSRPDLKVLLTSGYAQAAQPLGEMALSWRILSKPYALAELAEAIADVLKEG
jgi:signal transduction histidine kinase/ActR/RegA family two-component response regulator